MRRNTKIKKERKKGRKEGRKEGKKERIKEGRKTERWDGDSVQGGHIVRPPLPPRLPRSIVA